MGLTIFFDRIKEVFSPKKTKEETLRMRQLNIFDVIEPKWFGKKNKTKKTEKNSSPSDITKWNQFYNPDFEVLYRNELEGEVILSFPSRRKFIEIQKDNLANIDSKNLIPGLTLTSLKEAHNEYARGKLHPTYNNFFNASKIFEHRIHDSLITLMSVSVSMCRIPKTKEFLWKECERLFTRFVAIAMTELNLNLCRYKKTDNATSALWADSCMSQQDVDKKVYDMDKHNENFEEISKRLEDFLSD